MNFETRCINYIIDNFEGGYVSHPADPGGETKYGISGRQYPGLDIVSLTKSDAVEIYRKDFSEKIRFRDIAEINPRLAVCLLDCAIHSGPSRAIKILQKSGKTSQDGIIGPATLRVASDPEIVENYLAARAQFLCGLKNYPTFASGWLARLFRLAAMPF